MMEIFLFIQRGLGSKLENVLTDHEAGTEKNLYTICPILVAIVYTHSIT